MKKLDKRKKIDTIGLLSECSFSLTVAGLLKREVFQPVIRRVSASSSRVGVFMVN